MQRGLGRLPLGARSHHLFSAERTIRSFQFAVNSVDDPAAQARNILGVIKHLGLGPNIPPEPLPEIAREDVHLVAWAAVL